MLVRELTDYLRAGASPDRAARLAALVARELPLVADALEHHARGAPSFTTSGDESLTIHVGPKPPTGARPGHIWVDTVELTAATLVLPYLEPDLREAYADADGQAELLRDATWFAVQPVARFQYAAFLAVSGAPADRFDEAVGDPFAAVTAVTCGQASAYLDYFGKLFPTELTYQAAIERGEPVWGEPAREWVGTSTFDDTYRVAVTPNTVATDPQDTVGNTDPEWRMIYGAADAPTTITFRSCVWAKYGLRGGDKRFPRP